MAEVMGRGTRLLARIKAGLIFTPIQVLGDGSYLGSSQRIPDNARQFLDENF